MTESSIAESRYQSPSAGYRGGINPVFVSLSERENVAIRSKIPTPPPRNYFPVRPSSEAERTTEQEYSQVTERIFSNDNYVYNGFYKDQVDEITSAGPDSTTQLYSPPYEVTRPSQDQWSYWQTTTPSPSPSPPPYFDNSNIWPEYNKVVNHLLQDKGNNYQGTDSHKLIVFSPVRLLQTF